MFRKTYNYARIEGFLEPDGPVLIKSSASALDPVAPELAFVRTDTAAGRTVYLPGSSLKGVLRAHGERLLSSLVGESAAEDPFDKELAPRRKEAAAARTDKKRSNSEVYLLSCPSDRLYGSTELAGRFRVADALPQGEVRTEVRTQVAVNRRQGSGENPRDLEAVTGGSFRFEATLENFELWMLSLILSSLRDLDFGMVRVGHGKNRGFGVMRLKEAKVALRWLGERPPELRGVGPMETDPKRREAFDLDEKDVAKLPEPAARTSEGKTRTVFTPAEEGFYAGFDFLGYGDLQTALGLGPIQRLKAREGEVSHV